MYSIFRNLALILISAKFFALLARKCRAPQVVGEIIAGLVIGPCLLNLVQPSDSIAIFAEIGVVLLMWAWVNYLRLDGVTIHHLGEEFKDMGKKKKLHSTKSIVDFADERIVSFEELEPEERTYCSMLSNLILGGALLIIGLIAGAV